MNKRIITFATTVLLAIIAIVFYSCKKSKDTVTSRAKTLLSNNPNAAVITTFPDLDKINDHLRHLAFGMAALQAPAYLQGSKSNYITKMQDFVDAKTNNDETSFENINSTLSTNTIFKDINQTTPPYSNWSFDKVMIDAINQSKTPYSSLNLTRPFAWTGYDWTALTGFNYNYGDYFTLLRIPDWEILKNDPTLNFKELVVVSNELDANDEMVLPIVGFKYDWLNDEVKLVEWATEDELEAETFYYVWMIDYDAVPIAVNPTQYNCTGDDAPVANDDFCDVDCGENASNSQNDCNSNYLKKVWIEDIEIIEDYKKKCGNPKYQWMESRANGRYEMAYRALVAHGRGKAKVRGGEIDERWHRNEVPRAKKVNPSCNFNSTGTNVYKHGLTARWWWFENNEEYSYAEEFKVNQPKPYLSENYKPWRDTIYLIIYERDPLRPSRKRTIHISYRPGKMYDLEYYTYKNEGPFGDKTNTNSVVAYNSVTRAVFDPITVKAKLPLNSGQVIMITPNSWPNQGRISQMYDELTIEGEGSSNGNNADTWSLRVKLNYGPL